MALISESEADKKDQLSAKPMSKTRSLRDLPQVPLSTPFERIAVCMSGGGFRAAAFSLGTMTYLHRVQFKGKALLEKVCFISSASGGTITALCYALGKANGESFDKFFERVTAALKGDETLTRALTILNNKKEWGAGKKRTLINAFAKTYDRDIYKGAELSALYGIKQQLRICVNATEFYRGITYRFQNYGFIGNLFVSLDKNNPDVTGRLKLADVLAASSCFPTGFEPIEFPGDFTHAGVSEKQLREVMRVIDYNNQPIMPDTVPLMDGGITDNQGLYSAMNADLNARIENQSPLDLFIITDVGSYFMDNYEPPKTGKGLLRIFSLQTLRLVLYIIGGGVFLTSLYLLNLDSSRWWNYVGAFLLFPGVLVVGSLALNIIKWSYRAIMKIFGKKEPPLGLLRSVLQLNKSFSDGIINKLQHFLMRTRLSALEQMVKNRISSVVTMVSDVNLKQIRRLVNDLFYQNRLFDNRRCSNYIYEYSTMNFVARKNRVMNSKHWPPDMKELMIPTVAMQTVAEGARTMGTTLWFDKEDTDQHMLRKLVACGQFTVCGSLLEYILDLEANEKVWKSLAPEVQGDVLALKKNLIDDWRLLQSKPEALSPI